MFDATEWLREPHDRGRAALFGEPEAQCRQKLTKPVRTTE
jgi:hypothetical protein